MYHDPSHLYRPIRKVTRTPFGHTYTESRRREISPERMRRETRAMAIFVWSVLAASILWLLFGDALMAYAFEMTCPGFACASLGIDYGRGLTNIDGATGIRYGVIPANDVGQTWYDESEADYGSPYCPRCGTEADKPDAFGDTFKVDGVVDCYEFEDEDEYTDEDHESRDYVCVGCKHFFGSESAFGDEPIGHYYAEDGLEASQTDTDIFVTKSPFYTYAPFCSPCAPGAGYLADALPVGPISVASAVNTLGLVKTYCFGHDWFDDGKAPYRVFKVEDDSEVFS